MTQSPVRSPVINPLILAGARGVLFRPGPRSESLETPPPAPLKFKLIMRCKLWYDNPLHIYDMLIDLKGRHNLSNSFCLVACVLANGSPTKGFHSYRLVYLMRIYTHYYRCCKIIFQLNSMRTPKGYNNVILYLMF